MDMDQLDLSTAQLAAKVSSVEDNLQKLDQAISSKVLRGESDFLMWTPDDVAMWLKRCENGRYLSHKENFLTKGITGKMLLALTPDDLVNLGMHDLSSRRSLLDAI